MLIGRIAHVNDDSSYDLHLYVRNPNSMIYWKPIQINHVSIQHNEFAIFCVIMWLMLMKESY
jgi:hypothetical protein